MSLFQGTPQTAATYASSTSETPKWMQDAIYNQVQWAQNIANTPYQPYSMPTVAELSPLQQQAYKQVQSNQGNWQPALGAAQQGTYDLSNTKSVDNISSYMNPYQQNVLDTIAKQGSRNLTENLLPGVSDAFVKAGGFGGTRMGEFGSRALRDTQEAVLNQQAQSAAAGYGQAMTAANADLTRQGTNLNNLASLAQAQQGMGYADTGALEAAGGSQQAQMQAQLNAAQQQYQNEQLYPKQQMDWLNTQIRGMAPITPQTTTQSGTTTGATYSPSPLSQLATGLYAYKGLNSLGG